MSLDPFSPMTDAGWEFHWDRFRSFPEEHGFRSGAFSAAASLILLFFLLRAWRLRPGTLKTSPGPPFPGPSLFWIRFGAIASGALALAIHVGSLGGVPHTADERAYTFQAHLFASGHLASRPRTLPLEASGDLYVVPGPRGLASKYTPGWSLMLVPGTVLGLPGLTPVLLWIGTILLAHRVFVRRLGATWGGLAALILAASPMGILQAASLLAHSGALFLVFLGIDGADRSEQAPLGAAMTLGISTAGLLTVRPTDALLLAPQLYRLCCSSRRQRMVLAVCIVAGVGLDMAYTRVVFGRMALAAHEIADPLYHYGFSPDVGQSPEVYGHNLAGACMNLVVNGLMLNEELWGWASTSLVFVVIGAWTWIRRRERIDRDLLLGGALLTLFFCGHFHHGGSHGARYYHSLLPLLTLLSVEGLRSLLGEGPITRPVGLTLILCHIVMAGSYLEGRGRALINYAGVHSSLIGLDTSPRKEILLIGSPPPGTADVYPSLFVHTDPLFETGPLTFRLSPLETEANRRGQTLATLVESAYPGWIVTLVRVPGSANPPQIPGSR